jgi:hypothetical protein
MSGIYTGGTRQVGRRVGTSEVIKVYVGDDQIWPPAQKVTYVGSTVSSGNAPTFPAHQAGDLMVVAAQGSSSTSTPVPSLPSGWTQAYRSSSNQGAPVLIGYKFATAGNTAGGSWANAAYTCAYVFRGADTTTPFGAFNSTMNAASTPAVTPVNTEGESVLVHYFYNNGTTGGWGASPVGFVGKNAVARLGNLLRLDSTIGAGAAWSHTASPVPNFRTVQFEVLPVAPVVEEEPLWLYDVDITYKGGNVVDFTAKKGFVPAPEDAIDEGFMFRCVQFPALDGYVRREFSKTFPQSGYSKLDCTLEDLYGDGIPANNAEMLKTLSFTINPTA